MFGRLQKTITLICATLLMMSCGERTVVSTEWVLEVENKTANDIVLVEESFLVDYGYTSDYSVLNLECKKNDTAHFVTTTFGETTYYDLRFAPIKVVSSVTLRNTSDSSSYTYVERRFTYSSFGKYITDEEVELTADEELFLSHITYDSIDIKTYHDRVTRTLVIDDELMTLFAVD